MCRENKPGTIYRNFRRTASPMDEADTRSGSAAESGHGADVNFGMSSSKVIHGGNYLRPNV